MDIKELANIKEQYDNAVDAIASEARDMSVNEFSRHLSESINGSEFVFTCKCKAVVLCSEHWNFDFDAPLVLSEAAATAMERDVCRAVEVKFS